MISGSDPPRYPMAIPVHPAPQPTARLLTPAEVEAMAKGTPRQIIDRVNRMSTGQCVWASLVLLVKLIGLPAIVVGLLVEGLGGPGFLLSWLLGGTKKGGDT